MKKVINSVTLAMFTLLPTAALALTPYDAPDVEIKTPSTNASSLESIIGLIVAWVLLLVGGIAVFFLIWGGLQYITSSGNKDKAEQAKQTITYSVIGLIVVVLARVIVDLTLGLPLSLGISTN